MMVSLGGHGWGFHAHRLINRNAVYALPTEMFLFYKHNIDYLEAHSVDPDRRRYTSEGEAPKHYIDLDRYLKDSVCLQNVRNTLPLYWKGSIDSLLSDSLSLHGILPWNLSFQVFRLSMAFKTGDARNILRLSAEIGHYAGDAHVPLHTTENYNGQLTGQHGIHALWESSIPEAYSDEYVLCSNMADYLENIQLSVWNVILDSHHLLDTVLRSERRLRNEIRPDRMYSSINSSWSSRIIYSDHYVEQWNSDMGQLVEQRMTESALFVASLWYTAWINAGQPDLSLLDKAGCRFDLDSLSSEEQEPEHH